jgi:hypothetical protein
MKFTKGTKLFFLGSRNDIKYKENNNYERMEIGEDGLVVYVPSMVEKQNDKSAERLKEQNYQRARL